MYELPGFETLVEGSVLITSGALLVGGPLLGWVLQRIALGRLKSTLATAQWGVGDVISRAIHDLTIFVVSLVSAYVAIDLLPLNPTPDVWLKRVVIMALVAVVALAITRTITDTIKLFALRSGRPTGSSSIFINLARIIVAVVALLVLLQALGVPITALLGAMGVAGLAVALAAQDTLGNFFAGLQLVATKKVKAGDYIKLDSGEEGYVVDIDWRHTSVRTLPNNVVMIPNSQLVDSAVTNYNYPYQEMSIVVGVGVSYASDLEHVERVTLEVATELQREAEAAVDDFEPFLRFHTFGDSSIDMNVILRTKHFADQYPLTHEFIKRLHRRFNQEGIVIPFPIRTIDWPDAPKGR